MYKNAPENTLKDQKIQMQQKKIKKNALNLENCAWTSVVWPVYVGVSLALALAVAMALAVGSIGFNAVICTVEI